MLFDGIIMHENVRSERLNDWFDLYTICTEISFFFQVSLGFINIYIFYFYPFKGGEVEVSKEFEEKIITTVNVLQGNTN